MTEEELRRAYGALRRQQQEPSANGPVERPSPEALASALSGELEPGERVRILDRALSAGAADEVALVHALHTAARSATGRARSPSTTRGGVLGRRWPILAAAAVLGAVMVPLARDTTGSPSASRQESMRFRGGSQDAPPQLVAPAGGAPLPADGRFAWHVLPGAQRYLFEALDSSGHTITSLTTADTLAILPDSVSADARARIAGWWVTATLSTGAGRRSELRLIAAPQRP